MIGPLGPQPVARHRRFPAPLAFPPLLRHAESFLAPHALHPLAIDAPALIEQMLMRLAVSPPRSLAGERTELRPERRVVLRDEWLAALS